MHLDIHEIPGRPDLPAHLHLDVRFLLIAKGEELLLSDESTDVRWWPLSTLPHDVSDTTRVYFKALLRPLASAPA